MSDANGVQRSAQRSDLGIDELTVLRARLRNGHSVVCDRCKTSLTLSSTTESEARMAPHLLRVSIELGWTLSQETAVALGALVAPQGDRDLCPVCRKLLDTASPKSR